MINYESKIYERKEIRDIDRGIYRIKHEEFSLGEWASELHAYFLERSRENNFALKAEYGEVYENSLVGDPKSLSKVMKGLFELATVVVPKNRTIVFCVEQLSDFAADYTFLRLILKTQGKEVKRDALNGIVLSSPITAGEDAAHLLVLSRKLLSFMHGSLTFQITEGSEVIFTVAVPLYRHASANFNNEEGKSKFTDMNNVDLTGIRVLVGLSNKLEQEIVEAVFSKFKIKCDFAVRGGEILGNFLVLPPETYQCIITDINFTDMTGFDMARTLRGLPHLQSKKIPIIGMTDSSFVEAVAMSFEAGMNDCMMKPIDFRMLLKYFVCLANEK